MTTAATAGRFRLATPATALVLGVLVLALMAVSVPLAVLDRSGLTSGAGSFAFFVAFGIVGFVVARRQPANPMGWIQLGAAGFLALSGDAGLYAVLDYRQHHGRLPMGWVAVLLQPTWAPAIVLFGLAVLLFPDGELPSRRWRWVLLVYLAIGTLWLAGAFTIAAGAIIGHSVQVTTGGDLTTLNNPTGSAAWWGTVQAVFLPLLGVSLLASLGGQVLSYLRSAGERRLQLKWLVSGSAICIVSAFPTVLWSSGTSGALGVAGKIAFVGLLALPVSIGVAILKYRLYEIDRLVSRTLAYAIVTGLLIGVYVGIVTLAGQVASSPVWVAASTLAAAALFNPLRRRVQRVVDRRFNRARYDAEATTAAFAARLQDAVDIDTVRSDLLAVVIRAVEPAHASVWVNAGRS